jgi:hypothetical protein
MNPFQSLLQRWDNTLRKYNPKFYEELYPPLPAEEISSKLNALGCNDEDLKAWFGWKNGIDPDKDPDIECMIFYFGAMPLSLDAVSGIAGAYHEDKMWSDSFIPLATEAGSLYLLFNTEAGDDYGKIYLYSVSLLVIDPVSYYDSIAAMIETTILEYEQGVLVYDPEEDWLNEDNAAHHDIARSINTHSDYWILKGPSYHRTKNGETEDRLQELEMILKKSNAPVLKYLNPGLAREEIATFFTRHNINPSPALMALYEWHNGVVFPFPEVTQAENEIFPMGIFYCLDFMLMSWKDVIEWNYMEDAADYIPLFGSGESDIYLLKNSTGEIFYMSPAIQNFGEFCFTSIDVLLDFIIECYRERVLTIDPEKGLVVEDEEYFEKKERYGKL